MAYVTQADAVGYVGVILAHVSTSAPRWVIDGVIDQLVNLLATRDNDVALFVCVSVFHISII